MQHLNSKWADRLRTQHSNALLLWLGNNGLIEDWHAQGAGAGAVVGAGVGARAAAVEESVVVRLCGRRQLRDPRAASQPSAAADMPPMI